ncbi:unnamed protein product [Calypogeia fissa]
MLTTKSHRFISSPATRSFLPQVPPRKPCRCFCQLELAPTRETPEREFSETFHIRCFCELKLLRRNA